MVADIALSLTIDYTANTVVMQSHGPSKIWHGFGFGNTVMDGTYSIIMEYTTNDFSEGLVTEFGLGNHRAGTTYTNPTLTILSDMNDGQTRTVTVRVSVDLSIASTHFPIHQPHHQYHLQSLGVIVFI